jgi:hypothetical protein
MAQASIRHLAHHGGLLGFAMQWQGDPAKAVPLLGLHRRGGRPLLCAADAAEQPALQGYAGSVAMDGSRIGLTAPRGGRLHLFGHDGAFLAALRRPDICGLAAAPAGGLVATDGLGAVMACAETLTPLSVAPRRAWDNHLVRLG